MFGLIVERARQQGVQAVHLAVVAFVRRPAMRAVNPKYILRNHLAEIAIRRAADERDYSEVNRLHALLTRPFDEQPEYEAYAAEPPDWARKIEVSCSS